FSNLQVIAVHPEAHRTAGLSPFESGLDENTVQAFRLRLSLDQAGSRDDQGLAYRRVDPFSPDDGCRGTQVFQPGVGAGADEDLVRPDVANALSGLQTHVVQAAL